MSKRYLLIVEGSKDEKLVFQNVFEKYGYHVVKKDKPLSVKLEDLDLDLFETELLDGKDEIQ